MVTVAAPAAAPAAAGVHPIHTTLTEVTYDEATHRVTLSVRAYADDFSAAVARRARTAPAADHAVSDAAGLAYLAASITLADRDGAPLRLEGCGVRRAGDAYRLCLRAVAPRGLAGVRLLNRCHFELYDDQINIVQSTVGGRRHSVLFTRGDGPKPVTS